MSMVKPRTEQGVTTDKKVGVWKRLRREQHLHDNSDLSPQRRPACYSASAPFHKRETEAVTLENSDNVENRP